MKKYDMADLEEDIGGLRFIGLGIAALVAFSVIVVIIVVDRNHILLRGKSPDDEHCIAKSIDLSPKLQ